MLQGLEVLGGFGGVADTLNMFNHYLGDPGYLPKDLDEHRKVTPATVKAFAQAVSAAECARGRPRRAGRAGLGAHGADAAGAKVAPGTGAEAVNADEAWRKDEPKPADAFEHISCRAALVQARQRPHGDSITSGRACRSSSRESRASGPAATRIPSIDPGSRTSRRRCSTRAPRAATRCRSPTTSRSSAPRSTRRRPRTRSTVIGRLAASRTSAPRSSCSPTSRCGRRFPQAEVERQRASRLAQPGRAAAGPARRSAPSPPWRALYGPAASVRLRRARHRGRRQGDDARRPVGVLEAELRAGQRRARRGRRR